MRNLAGNPDCDKYMRRELERADIPVLELDKPVDHPDVKARVYGQLGVFKFTRLWYYWNASGDLPLAIAQELYKDPVGRKDVRVAGHCGRPPPERPWVKWRAPDGRDVIAADQEAELARLPELIDYKPGKYIFNDDPASIGAKGFVEHYHIDSQQGLSLFADALRKHGLDTQPEETT